MKDKGWEGMQIPLDYLTLIGHIVRALTMEKVGYSGEQCVGVHIIPHGRFMFRCLYFGYCKYPTEYPALRPSL